MRYRRILTIQDISCLGQCSMTVALPVLSACGQESCILPSAILSTHTGGFSRPAIQGLTDFLPAAAQHWSQEGIRFDAIYTGYLGSCELIRRTEQIMDAFPGHIIVDPAMADHGQLYSGFDQTYVAQMRKLCARAEVLLPNITEAALLTGMPYRETIDENYTAALAAGLHDLGSRYVVLTGVGYQPGQTGVLVSGPDLLFHYAHPKRSRNYHGTGDIYAAAFTGCWLGGMPMEKAAALAADFACQCIDRTLADEHHWYGTRFETALPWLVSKLQNST